MSVFPLPQYAQRRHDGIREYVLPAAPRDSFSSLVIHGAVDLGIDYGPEPPQMLVRPIPVDVIVEDLVRVWTTNQLSATDAEGPGIGHIKSPAPTDDELAVLRARQETYFRRLVYEADGKASSGKVGDISDLHRKAAEWLGVEANRDWVKPIVRLESKRCVGCGESILMNALRCKHCQLDILDWALKYGVEKAEDPIVWQRVQMVRSKTQK